MRGKVINSIYIFALFLELLYESIPILPSLVQVTAMCMFVFYLIVTRIKIDRAYRNWTLTYILFFLLSAIWAIVPKFALFIIIVRLVPILIMVFATFTYIKNNSSLNGTLLVVFIVALLMLAYLSTHIEELVAGMRLGTSLNDEDEKKWNSNAIGINLCFAIFSGFILFINKKRNIIIRLLYIMTAVIMIIAILLTGSRKALLMLLIPFLYYIYIKKRKYIVLLLLIVPVLTIIFYEIVMNVEVFYLAIGTRMEDMFAIITGKTSGMEDSSRTELINYGLEWFWDNPILGVGLHNFRVLSNQTSRFAGYNFYAHNNYIELLVDVGIIGLFLYYRVYAYLYNELKGKRDVLSIWGMSFLIIMLFLGFGEVLYYETFEQLFFCLIFCIVDFNKRIDKLNIIKKYETSRYCSP